MEYLTLELRLSFEQHDNNCLPVNNQYELAGFVYKMLAEADQKYANEMHRYGLKSGLRTFKYFTFSRIHLSRNSYQFKGDHLQLKSGKATWKISFSLPATGFFLFQSLLDNRSLTVGNHSHKAVFAIDEVAFVRIDQEKYHHNRFWAESPICVSKPMDMGDGRLVGQYLEPDHPEFSVRLIKNLWQKLYQLDPEHELCSDKKTLLEILQNHRFEVTKKPKSKLITLKNGKTDQTKVRGYLFEFMLDIPEPLLQVGLGAGMGEKNAMGFGMVSLKRKAS